MTENLRTAYIDKDDWTMVKNRDERRKIQNRIAQRKYRKKLKKRLQELEIHASDHASVSSSQHVESYPQSRPPCQEHPAPSPHQDQDAIQGYSLEPTSEGLAISVHITAPQLVSEELVFQPSIPLPHQSCHASFYPPESPYLSKIRGNSPFEEGYVAMGWPYTGDYGIQDGSPSTK